MFAYRFIGSAVLTAASLLGGCSASSGGSTTGNPSASSSNASVSSASSGNTTTTDNTSSSSTTGSTAGGCEIQGQYSVTMQATLTSDSCQKTIIGPPLYEATVDGDTITLIAAVEQVPMPGSIDSSCHVQITYEAPNLSRIFDFTLDSNTLAGSGTFTEGDPSCPWVYNVTVQFSSD